MTKYDLDESGGKLVPQLKEKKRSIPRWTVILLDRNREELLLEMLEKGILEGKALIEAQKLKGERDRKSVV